MSWPLFLALRYLGPDEVRGTKSYNKRGVLPKRMRYLAPPAADSFLADLAACVVVSDMFRSAESSLWAIENRKGAKRPGTSGHNYGYSIDLNVRATMKLLGFRTKRELDEWMAARGWFCHRRDHRRGWEDWHYNFLGLEGGGYLRDSDRRTSWALERMLKAKFGRYWRLGKKNMQRALAKLGLYGGAIDGKIGPLSRQAVKAFQRTWKLKVDGIPGTKTQRTLAYVTADKRVVAGR